MRARILHAHSPPALRGAARWTPLRDDSPRYDRVCEALLRQIPLAMVAFAGGLSTR